MAIALPVLESVGRPQIAIPFCIPVTTAILRVQTSNRIPFKFRITGIELHAFNFSVADVTLYIVTHSSPTANVSLPPTGNNVFSPYSSTPYIYPFVSPLTISLNFIPPKDDSFISVYSNLTVLSAGLMLVIVYIEAV